MLLSIYQSCTDQGFQCSSASRKFLNLFGLFMRAAYDIEGFSALQRAENSSIVHLAIVQHAPYAFQCSSASRKFLNHHNVRPARIAHEFQCSSASRKFLNLYACQCLITSATSFSALQRAENSSMVTGVLNRGARLCFSALQRAENSSICGWFGGALCGSEFQCSSASRKFLNRLTQRKRLSAIKFQCSSASRKFLNHTSERCGQERLQFQCSSASRKFLNSQAYRKRCERGPRVSVLFSEPKIPQCWCCCRRRCRMTLFQCSSASRKFLNGEHRPAGRGVVGFQCSSASRKFLNPLLAP